MAEMDKRRRYNLLVQQRKRCRLCVGLTNPSDATCRRFDSEQIGPWSLWQGSLDADVLVVGQDWGDTSYFHRWRGRDQPFGNPTNENLRMLLRRIGYEVGNPGEAQHGRVFLTNLILCLKQGGLQAPVKPQWFENCTTAFFRPLVEVIEPKVVVALGKGASESILGAYGVEVPRFGRLSELMENSPYPLSDSSVLFPVYHCGAGGVNRNRSMEQQLKDWDRIGSWLREKGVDRH